MTGRGTSLAVGVAALATAMLAGCGTGADRAATGALAPPVAPTSTAPASPEMTVRAGGSGLDCATQDVVAPVGAPYCYTAPKGLPPIDLGAPTAGREGTFRTSFGAGPPDHVDIQVYDVGTDTDDLDDAEITDQLGGVVTSLEAGGFSFAGDPSAVDVHGARGFSYDGVSTDGRQHIVATFVFRGRTEVQLNCASTDNTDLIDAACHSVLASLHVIG